MSLTLFGPDSDAVISACGRYRYSLVRIWDEDLPRVCFVMLNPSTADATRNDNTVKKCMLLARMWGYGSLEIVNLFAWRATDPRQLRLVSDPVGPECDAYIHAAVRCAARVVAAWGVHGAFLNRDLEVMTTIGETWCLKITNGGHPYHPLYVANATELIPFSPKSGFAP